LQALVQDIHDAQLGTWVIDKTQNPQTLTIRRDSARIANSATSQTLAVFQLTDDPTAAQRLGLSATQ
jgi:hypothetical protein